MPPIDDIKAEADKSLDAWIKGIPARSVRLYDEDNEHCAQDGSIKILTHGETTALNGVTWNIVHAANVGVGFWFDISFMPSNSIYLVQVYAAAVNSAIFSMYENPIYVEPFGGGTLTISNKNRDIATPNIDLTPILNQTTLSSTGTLITRSTVGNRLTNLTGVWALRPKSRYLFRFLSNSTVAQWQSMNIEVTKEYEATG